MVALGLAEVVDNALAKPQIDRSIRVRIAKLGVLITMPASFRIKTQLLSMAIALTVYGAAVAQNPTADSKPKEFQAGKPLGATNEAGQFIPLTSNVKVYGSFRF